jgi:hypothetical protein
VPQAPHPPSGDGPRSCRSRAGRLDVAVRELDAVEVAAVPVPHDCTDGFLAAYWRRPQSYLDPACRAGTSGLALLPAGIVERAMARLAADLADGTWTARCADLVDLAELDCGYRLVTAGGSRLPPAHCAGTVSTPQSV